LNPGTKGRDDQIGNPAGDGVRWGVLSLTVLLGACADKTDPPTTIAGADAAAGLEIIERVGCASCHVIPGVRWPSGIAGPSLQGFADSPMIAGRLPNQPSVLVAFLIDAPSLAPDTGMPPMPLTQEEARDVAAYLYTLDE
jgi:mono/diheme cytochrome c family protein